MRTPVPPARPRLAIAGLLVVATFLAACSPAPAPAADAPAGVVHTALERLGAKDVAGLRVLACAGQEDLVRQQLGLAGMSGTEQLLPGVDTQALLDAITMDVGAVRVGSPTVSGDVATVPVTGSAKVTFDAAAMRPIVRSVLEQRGTTMSDAQLDSLLASLAAYGQAVPIEQTVRLVRENGAWKICQEHVEAPAQ
jgi:hypothetical protein